MLYITLEVRAQSRTNFLHVYHELFCKILNFEKKLKKEPRPTSLKNTVSCACFVKNTTTLELNINSEIIYMYM